MRKLGKDFWGFRKERYDSNQNFDSDQLFKQGLCHVDHIETIWETSSDMLPRWDVSQDFPDATDARNCHESSLQMYQIYSQYSVHISLEGKLENYSSKHCQQQNSTNTKHQNTIYFQWHALRLVRCNELHLDKKWSIIVHSCVSKKGTPQNRRKSEINWEKKNVWQKLLPLFDDVRCNIFCHSANILPTARPSMSWLPWRKATVSDRLQIAANLQVLRRLTRSPKWPQITKTISYNSKLPLSIAYSCIAPESSAYLPKLHGISYSVISNRDVHIFSHIKQGCAYCANICIFII